MKTILFAIILAVTSYGTLYADQPLHKAVQITSMGPVGNLSHPSFLLIRDDGTVWYLVLDGNTSPQQIKVPQN